MQTRREFLRQTTAAGLATAGITPAVLSGQPTPGDPAAATVQTVLGPIDAGRLGFTLPHEHVFAGSAGFLETWPEFVGGRAGFVAKAVERLKQAKAEGVDTIVDVTPVDVGRDIRLLEEVSRKSGIQIVACTGHWLSPSLSMGARTIEELAGFFKREIEQGIEDTGIKAGVIKVATDREGVTPFLEKALRAAARASKATGVPITTHTHAVGRMGEKQAEIFESEGVSPARVCLGHSDETNDMGYLTGLARRGYTLGMDHLPSGLRQAGAGAPAPLSWQQRADCVRQLIEAGLLDRIFLSNDWFFALSIAPTGSMEALDQMNPDGMLFNTRKTLPYLKQSGVTDQQIRAITVENPKRFFGGG